MVVLVALTALPAGASCGPEIGLLATITSANVAGLEVVGAVEYQLSDMTPQLPLLGRAWTWSATRSWADIAPPFEFERTIEPIEAGHGRSPCGGFPTSDRTIYTLVVEDRSGTRSLSSGGSGTTLEATVLTESLGDPVPIESPRLLAIWHAWWRFGLIVTLVVAILTAPIVRLRRRRARPVAIDH
jgi:hypothetical protein